MWPCASAEKCGGGGGGVIEGTSWMTNWGGYEMRLDLIRTLESTLPYSMYQMGSLSGAFPLIIPFQCYAPTPCWRNLTGGGGWAWGTGGLRKRKRGPNGGAVETSVNTEQSRKVEKSRKWVTSYEQIAVKVIWGRERTRCVKRVGLGGGRVWRAVNAAVRGTLRPGTALALYEVWRGRLPRRAARFLMIQFKWGKKPALQSAPRSPGSHRPAHMNKQCRRARTQTRSPAHGFTCAHRSLLIACTVTFSLKYRPEP